MEQGYLCVQIEFLPCFVPATVVDNRSSSSYDVSEHWSWLQIHDLAHRMCILI